jgi:hypothetical protein
MHIVLTPLYIPNPIDPTLYLYPCAFLYTHVFFFLFFFK